MTISWLWYWWNVQVLISQLQIKYTNCVNDKPSITVVNIVLHNFTHLMTGPSSSRCRKRTKGRSRPRSLWMNVSASWMSTAGSSMKVMVKLIQMTSSVLRYMLQSTAAVTSSAQYSTVASTTLKGAWTRLWWTTSVTPFSAVAEHSCGSMSVISRSCSSMATSHILVKSRETVSKAGVRVHSSRRPAFQKHHFLHVFRLMRRLSQLSTKSIIAGVSSCWTPALGGATCSSLALTRPRRLVWYRPG